MELQRYTWQDALTEYVTLGIITQAQYNAANRLAHAVTWSAKGKPPGLYWADELAFASVGLSRTTGYDRRSDLEAAGFFKRVGGNLIPTLPDNYDAVHETFEARKATLTTEHIGSKSENPDSQSENSDYQSEHSDSQSENSDYQSEHSDSQSENSDSQSENSDQCSVDSFTVEVSSGDSVSDTAPVVADAPTATVHASPLQQGESNSPSMGAVWLSEAGDLLFEVDTGSGRYLLCESGVSAPVPLPETRTAAPTKHRSQVEAEQREQQRRDALAATYGPEYLTGEW